MKTEKIEQKVGLKLNCKYFVDVDPQFIEICNNICGQFIEFFFENLSCLIFCPPESHYNVCGYETLNVRKGYLHKDGNRRIGLVAEPAIFLNWIRVL